MFHWPQATNGLQVSTRHLPFLTLTCISIQAPRPKAGHFFLKNPQSPGPLSSPEGGGRVSCAELPAPPRKPAVFLAMSSVCTFLPTSSILTHLTRTHTPHLEAVSHSRKRVEFGVRRLEPPSWLREVGTSFMLPVPQSPRLHDRHDHSTPATWAYAERSPTLLLRNFNLSFKIF